MTVWIYVDTSKPVGDKDHLKVFPDRDAAERWFREHDPEGVAFEYPVEGTETPRLGIDKAEGPAHDAPDGTHRAHHTTPVYPRNGLVRLQRIRGRISARCVHKGTDRWPPAY